LRTLLRASVSWNVNCSEDVMRTLTRLSVIALCMASLGGSLAAHAQDELPSDANRTAASLEPAPAAEAELEKLLKGEHQPLTPLEQRTVEIIREAAHAADTQQSPSDAALSNPGDPENAEPGTSVDLAASPANENARDPCLLSWDPRCYAKHAADYDPRWGYAPSVLRRHGLNVSANSDDGEAKGQ
jgi:hypothetical protein